MTSGHPAGYSAISSYSRVEILHLIQEQSQRTIAELVDATGLHANTVREHLQRLIDDGYIIAEPEKRTTRGRPRVLYSAADGAETSSPIQRRKVRAAAERGDLMRRVLPETDATELDTAAVHQLDAVVEDLLDAGFDPVVDEQSLTIDLTPCAHATAQAGHRDVLCRVHLGLVEGVLREAGGPLTVTGMLPACDPSECVVQLRLRGDATRP
ncbi:helix-turn-helix transcriptional regulator [Microbacterium sp. No. 7]|uniref:helix-turn-helix transcriptional regulator n=1 Tax=Microbacterium sp. No. 7 TaxID=1714373 RepID=UPI0006CF9DBC|nr:winged helix-turn-helix transcriptional regulator [Microbacterium sp. No. 7]ALJ19418.1 transcriptional regulator [Microbacterium sp. No. 7]